MNDGKRAYSLLKELSFERIGGSSKEKEALQIIKKALPYNENVNIDIEEFQVDASNIESAEFFVTEPKFIKYEVKAFRMCSSFDLSSEIIYLENPKLINRYQINGKIVLLASNLTYKIYEELTKRGASGLVVASGSVYDDVENTDLEERFLRERHYKNGKIPTLSIRMRDFQDLLRSNPKKAHITIKQNEYEATSHNLVATIKGNKYPDEIIAFTAHYDSVRFSQGSYDNATGAVTIYEVYNYFLIHQPARTLKFIWCGSEEMGLLGSHAYVNKHKEELNKYLLCLNVDMTGVTVGYDIAVVTGEMNLVNYIDYFSKRIGEIIECAQDIYSSDSTPFADQGIPAVTFARISPRGGAQIHSRKDLIDFIDEYYLGKMISFIIKLSSELIEAVNFPVERNIPDNMKTKLNEYLGR